MRTTVTLTGDRGVQSMNGEGKVSMLALRASFAARRFGRNGPLLLAHELAYFLYWCLTLPRGCGAVQTPCH